VALVLLLPAICWAASPAEISALEDLYWSTNGPHWTDNKNWLNGDPCTNKWVGVVCDPRGHIVELFLNNNQLRGSIPATIGILDDMYEMSLDSNQLSGSIPATIGNIYGLDGLWLYNNQLSGSIPATIGSLSIMRELWLNDNQLTGSIPAAIGNISALRNLYLQNNHLSGTLPPFLQQQPTYIPYFNARNNSFSCPLPMWCSLPPVGNGECLPCVDITSSGYCCFYGNDKCSLVSLSLWSDASCPTLDAYSFCGAAKTSSRSKCMPPETSNQDKPQD